MGHNFETIISGEMLGIPTQCQTLRYRRHWSENMSQLIPFCLTTTSTISVIRSLKNFNWLLHWP